MSSGWSVQSPRFRIVAWIDSNADGVAAISRLLAEYHGLSAIHLVSHASVGALQLAGLGEVEHEFGIKPRWSLECFKDPYQDVRQSMSRLQRVPYLMDKAHIRGFVYEMADGLLHEVEPDPRHMNLGPSGIDL